MGVFGGILGTGAGQLAGHHIGNAIGGKTGEIIGDVIGGLGTAFGALLPFKKGGKVKKTGPAYVHKGEVVLPVNTVKDLGRLFHTSPHHMVKTNGQRVLNKKNKRKRK